jgi:hypothetical protein
LRHSLSLHRIERADDGQMRGHIAIRQQLIDAGAGAGDELERGEPRGDPGASRNASRRLDVGRRSGQRVTMNLLIGRKLRERCALLLDER